MEPRVSDTARPEQLSASTPLKETQLSAKVRVKLEKLAERRLDASRLTILADGPRVEGGFAVVCRAHLTIKDGDDEKHENGSGDGGGDDTNNHSAGVTIGEQAVRHLDVAIKMMKIKDGDDMYQVLKRAVREADLIADLNHKNIIKLGGFVEDLSNGEIWLIFPWAEMGNVRDFVASKDWSIPERLWLIRGVTDGVEYLHSQDPPICHGDLKSINILVNSDSRAIITDFGSARRVKAISDEQEQEPGLVQRGTLDDTTLSVEFCQNSNTITLTGPQYTLRWVAPEVLGEANVGTPADIWSMGWVFYEIMTGSIPFEDLQKDAAIIRHIVKGEFPSIKDHHHMSPILSLVSLMTMCWEIVPKKRPSAERCRKYVSHIPMCPPCSKEASGTALETANRLFSEGIVYISQNDYVRALAFFTDALKELDHPLYIKSKVRTEILRGIAEVHRTRNEYGEAAALYAEVFKTFEEIGDRRGTASAQFGLAEIHRARNEYGEAVALYGEVVKICEEIGDRRGKASAQCGLAETHRARNKYGEAVALYAEVVKIREEIGDRRGKADAQFGLAEVHRVRGEYDEAVALYGEVVKIREEIGDRRGKADAQWGLATIHRARNEYDEAAALYVEVVKICEEIGDRRGKADAQWGLATIHRARNEYNEAVALYAEVVKIREEIGDRSGKADAQFGLAEVHRVRGEYDEAVALYGEVVKLREEIGDRRGKADAQWGLATIHRARNEYDEAAAL